MYPRARLDALSDAIFGVAMTLLILDVRLPDSFRPSDAHELLQGLLALTPKFGPYVLSFVVLGLRWLSNVQVRSQTESVGRDYTAWWILYLLLITCVPFTTMVIGRFAHLAPAIWLYAGNTALVSIVSFRLLAHTPGLANDARLRERRVSLAILILSSLLAIAVSFIDPRYALWAFVLNFVVTPVNRWRGIPST
jgi:uncharacterized membrane protein